MLVKTVRSLRARVSRITGRFSYVYPWSRIDMNAAYSSDSDTRGDNRTVAPIQKLRLKTNSGSVLEQSVSAEQFLNSS